MTDDYTSYLDFYQKGPYAPYLKEHRSAGSAPVNLLMAAQPEGDFSDAPTPDFTLQFLRTSARARLDFGAGRYAGYFSAGDLFLAPPNSASSVFVENPHELQVVALPSSMLRSLLTEVSPGFEDFGRLHAAPVRDPFVETLVSRIWDEAADGNALGSLFADAAVQALALMLLRMSQQGPVEPEPVRGGLAPFRLRRVLDCVESRLGEDLSMVDLAGAAELSPLYFARAFRQETGTTPHRHLLERRIERAKRLLTATEMPIVEIAAACGFCDQSHLARWFKRIVGATPSRWREDR